MGISHGRTRPCTHRPEREHAHQHASSGCTGRMSLKKCVFGCEGNITLFSVTWTVDADCFTGQLRSFSSVFADERFINKAQFDARFAHRLILKDGAVPAIKDPGHDSELQAVSEMASNACVLLVIALKCSSLFSSAHCAPPPRARLFSETILKLYLSLINYNKTKDFLEIWRMQYYSIRYSD